MESQKPGNCVSVFQIAKKDLTCQVVLIKTVTLYNTVLASSNFILSVLVLVRFPVVHTFC